MTEGALRVALHRLKRHDAAWEVVVKVHLGRLQLPEPAWPYIARQRDWHGIDSLALQEAAVAYLAKLPPVHRDPFDRMLICQALEHDLLLVTDDQAVCRYPINPGSHLN